MGSSHLQIAVQHRLLAVTFANSERWKTKSRFLGLKSHGYSIHAVSSASWGRPILKHMTQVALTFLATNLQGHADCVICCCVEGTWAVMTYPTTSQGSCDAPGCPESCTKRFGGCGS